MDITHVTDVALTRPSESRILEESVELGAMQTRSYMAELWWLASVVWGVEHL